MPKFYTKDNDNQLRDFYDESILNDLIFCYENNIDTEYKHNIRLNDATRKTLSFIHYCLIHNLKDIIDNIINDDLKFRTRLVYGGDPFINYIQNSVYNGTMHKLTKKEVSENNFNLSSMRYIVDKIEYEAKDRDIVFQLQVETMKFDDASKSVFEMRAHKSKTGLLTIVIDLNENIDNSKICKYSLSVEIIKAIVNRVEKEIADLNFEDSFEGLAPNKPEEEIDSLEF